VNVDWKKFFTKDFWSNKEISYQYVHTGNSIIIVLVLLSLNQYFIKDFGFKIFSYVSGFFVGISVELYQWYLKDNKKLEDTIRDLFFWLLGNILGLIIWFK